MSSVFRILLHTRDRLYKSGVFPTHRLHHPVISIGNLTLGGTGKTPLVIALANRMREEGFRPVVLSRGYRRTTKGCLIVSRGDGPVVSWQESGDEPFLIARRASGVPVVVGADRFEAGRLAEQNDLGNVFLLDDGFQHRGLYRNVDLVTVDPVEWSEDESFCHAGDGANRNPRWSALTRYAFKSELAPPHRNFQCRRSTLKPGAMEFIEATHASKQNHFEDGRLSPLQELQNRNASSTHSKLWEFRSAEDFVFEIITPIHPAILQRSFRAMKVKSALQPKRIQFGLKACLCRISCTFAFLLTFRNSIG